MKITKLNNPIFGEDGITPIPQEKGGNMTFRDVCIRSMIAVMYDERGKPEDDKHKLEKWDIYKLFRDAKGEVELSIEQMAILKKWIGYWQPQMIMGQSYEILESMNTDKEFKKK